MAVNNNLFEFGGRSPFFEIFYTCNMTIIVIWHKMESVRYIKLSELLNFLIFGGYY